MLAIVVIQSVAHYEFLKINKADESQQIYRNKVNK